MRRWNMAADDKKKAEVEVPKGPSPLMKFLPLIFAAVSIVAGLGGVYLVYISTLGWERAPVFESQLRDQLDIYHQRIAGETVIYTMEPFVVNLEGVPRKSIRLEVNLELLDPDAFREVVTLGPEARDSIVRLLNGTRFEQIESIQGKLFLKDQILVALNNILDHGVVKDVYFSDFVAQ
jgi:flagellar FliL protein